MRFHLILNPSSRSGRGQRLWDYWFRGLKKAGVVFSSYETQGTGDACREVRKIVGSCVVVAVGGDGTINEVLDGVLQSGNRALSMGVLYAGTSPDFCRFHGIPTDTKKALEKLIQAAVTPVDVCRIHFRNEDGEERVGHFACSFNVGMGAGIARMANSIRRYLGDVGGTGTAVVKNLLCHKKIAMKVTVDGVDHVLRDVNNLTVAKNPYIASGLKLNLPLTPTDGTAWVFAVYGKSPLGMLRLLPRYYTGSVTSTEGVFLKKGKQMNIVSDRTHEIEFDGDPRGRLPVTIDVLPKSLNLLGCSHG